MELVIDDVPEPIALVGPFDEIDRHVTRDRRASVRHPEFIQVVIRTPVADPVARAGSCSPW